MLGYYEPQQTQACVPCTGNSRVLKLIGPWEMEVIKQVYFTHSFTNIDILSTYSEIGRQWVPQNHIYEKSTLPEPMLTQINVAMWRH